MSDQFHVFSTAVHQQFLNMSKGELFVVDIDGDALYDAYQAAFPAGTNEVFRVAREHECSTCKNFIRNIGNVVAIKDGLIITVWDDFAALPEPYRAVAARLSFITHNARIKSIFRAEQPAYGALKSAEPASEKNGNKSFIWNHFATGTIAKKHYAGNNAAMQVGQANNDAHVFKRGLLEITQDAISTAYELLSTKGALYRGDEFKDSFSAFLALKTRYAGLASAAEQDAFIWANYGAKGARLRNTAFGTLLIDLSSGMDTEAAVKRWETVMAPTNYKRPTALITPSMIKDAMKTIHDLGIEDSLQRRFASISDVNVNDILYVDNNVRGKMKGELTDLLLTAVVQLPPTPNKAKDINMADFVKLLPKATSLELYVANHHQSNFVSLTAPVNSGTTPLFKWDNGFAWSYDGNITDSIKERVKAAGGATEGAMRISLAWFNYDDLDLHVIETPTNKRQSYEISFRNRGTRSPMGGKLDVDMNAGYGATREAVENVVYDRLTDGTYQVVVNNFTKRETSNPGFTLELAVGGKTMHYSANASPSSGHDNHALVIHVKNGQIEKVGMGPGIEGRAFSQEKWGIKTEQFTRVDTVMLSPNYWGSNAVGNMHFIFVLEGCKNDVPTRGIYNEFLRPDLEKHRKVFEVLGNKTMAEPTNDQISGVGFSSTREDTVIVRLNNGQLYNVKF